MLRDKRTLALLVIAPLFILTLMYFFFNTNTVPAKLGIINVDQSTEKLLEKSDIKLTKYTAIGNNSVKELIIRDGLDAVLQANGSSFMLTLLNSDPNQSKALQMELNQIIMSKIQINQGKFNIVTNYVYGSKNTTFFDVLSPMLVGFFVFFFVFIISGIGLLRERTTGTLERLMSTPIRRSEVVTGYLVGFGIFAVIQTILVIIFAINILNVTIVGSILNVVLINLLLAFVALSFGILLSTFASSEFQMMQFIPIVIVPQVFFSGIFPIEGMAYWLKMLSKIMPIYYAADALKGVMYKGWNLSEIKGDIFALVLFSVAFIVLNILVLKKYRVEK